MKNREAKLHERIRDRVARLRRASNLSKTEVAALAGIPVSTYTSLENGNHHFTLGKLDLVLKALHADISEVWPSASSSVPITGQVDPVINLSKLSFFRLRELWVFSRASAAVLLIRSGQEVRPLAILGTVEKKVDGLVSVLEHDMEASRVGEWSIISRHATYESIFVALENAQLTDFVERLCGQYLEVWLATLRV